MDVQEETLVAVWAEEYAEGFILKGGEGWAGNWGP